MVDVVNFIQQVGFPIFVAMYVLMRIEPVLSKLDRTIRIQTVIIAKMNNVDYDDVESKYGFDKGR